MRQSRYRPAMGGFTITEVMVMVGIVAILVALAVPAYRDYSIRAKVAECINNAAVGKVGVSEYRQVLGTWPPSLADAGLTATSGVSHYCNALSNYQASTGAFTIDVNEAVIDSTLPPDSIAPVFTPVQAASMVINWECSQGATDAAHLRYLPATCRDS